MPQKIKEYSGRFYVLLMAVIIMTVIFITRLFFLQISSNSYKESADNNAFLRKTFYPARGIIYDRNDKLVVYNQPTFDVMIIMQEAKGLDTLDLCNTLGITKERFIKRIAEIKNRRFNPGYSSYTPQTFMNQLSAQECGVFLEKLYKFPGFSVQNRIVRKYAYPNAAHVLGNIGEVSKGDIKADAYYVQGDYSGRSGIEKSYEKELRGKKGVEILLRDAHGRIKGHYANGQKDQSPVSGKNLKLSIDMELQAYGEKLMQNKRGSIVMIEPETGEVLCMVSAPTYDPSMLVGRQRGKNNALLEKDPLKPLFDRSMMAGYPPGSTFKPLQGLIFLQEGIIDANTLYTCFHGYPFRGGKPACHGHFSPLGLVPALATSCNAYFCWGLREMLDKRKHHPSIQEAFEVWKNHVVSLGYGYKLGIDLPGEKRGYIPNSKVYDKIYGGRWTSSTIISIAIGQGEILATPLQICNFTATIANRGHFITPHVVKEIQNEQLDTLYTNKRYPTIQRNHYDLIVEGMRAAVLHGTCIGANIPNIEVCGKTGTSENPHGKDHSIFSGFAPKENPKVAICVFVENAGFGATYAVPIGRLMMEKYMNDTISVESERQEERIINTQILTDKIISTYEERKEDFTLASD